MGQYCSGQSIFFKHRDVLCLQIFIGYIINLVAFCFWIFFQGLVLSIDGLEQQNILHTVIEFLIFQAAKLDKCRNIIPVFFIAWTVIFKDLMQLVRNLLGDVLGNLLYFAVILQKASGNIKRHVRTIDNTL